MHAPGRRLHRSPGVQSWRGLVSTSGSMCSRSERSPVAAELALGLALRRCDPVLWHCHRALTWTPHVSGPLEFRLVVIRHCVSSGVAACCAPLDCGCGCLLHPRAVALHLLPPLACPRGRVLLRLLPSSGVAAYCAPLDCGCGWLLRPRCVVTCPRWRGTLSSRSLHDVPRSHL